MSIFEKDFLERVKSPKTPTQTQEAIKQSENVPEQRPDTVEELARKARAAGHTGPLVLGPSGSGLKGSWRDDAKWLEENFPEDYAAPKTTAASRPSCGTRSLDNCEARVEPQPLANAPESPQSAMETSADLPSIAPELPASWWQGLLYGSPDALLSPGDANTALRLVAHELLTHCDGADFTETVRAGALRKALSGASEQKSGML
jgi:hypothetical protein